MRNKSTRGLGSRDVAFDEVARGQSKKERRKVDAMRKKERIGVDKAGEGASVRSSRDFWLGAPATNGLAVPRHIPNGFLLLNFNHTWGVNVRGM